jgi:hypothetical protein
MQHFSCDAVDTDEQQKGSKTPKKNFTKPAVAHRRLPVQPGKGMRNQFRPAQSKADHERCDNPCIYRSLD